MTARKYGESEGGHGLEPYVNQIVLTAIGIAVGGAIGYVTGVFKKSRASEKAMATIMKALARDYVKDAYQKYIVEEHTMTIAAYDELGEVYEAYRILGGNGTAKKYMEKLRAREPFLVTE